MLKTPNAATAMASSTVLARPSDPLPAMSVQPGPSPRAPSPRSSRRSTTGTITTFSANDSPARTYRSGRCRAAATTTASTEISADCAAYSRTWSRSSACRNMPNSTSSTPTAITFALPENTPGGAATAAPGISHLPGRG